MSTYTTNYNFIKPEYSDDADVGDINGNMDSIDTLIKELYDDKQDATDNSLNTTSKDVVGAINELLTDKQPITDNTLNTTAKTVPGAINELQKYTRKTLVAASFVSLQGGLVTWAESMENLSVAVAYIDPQFSNTYFDGAIQPAIMVRKQSGVYRVSFPCIGLDGYYYSSTWHWKKATMS